MSQHIKNPLVFYSTLDKWWVFASCSCGWYQSRARNSANIMEDTSEEDVQSAWVNHFMRGFISSPHQQRGPDHFISKGRVDRT